MIAVLSAITACSTPNWQPISEAEIPVPESSPNDLAAHIYQFQGTGRDSTIEAIAKLAEAETDSRISADDTVDNLCRIAYAGGGTQRDRFVCTIEAALDWHRRKDVKTPLELMLFFNGGLNDKRTVLNTAFDSYRHIKGDNLYPIYMFWPTGIWDTYREDWFHIRAGRYESVWDPKTLATTPLRPFNDLLLGLASTPSAWATSSVEVARASRYSEESGFEVLRDKHLQPEENAEGKRPIDHDHNVVFSKEVDDPRRGSILSTIGDQALYLGLTPIRLATTPAIGPGFALWRNMVRRTRTAFRDQDEYPDESDVSVGDPSKIDCTKNGKSSSQELRHCHPKGSGAFGKFFQWLDACINGPGADCPLKRDEDHQDWELLKTLKLTLIGHSMGAIVVNEAVSAYPDLPYRDIVFMAGAASVQETADTLSPVLRQNQGCTRFFNLMLHPLNDSLERTGYGSLLSGSLLTYIDEYLELPKTLPDRTIGQWRNLRLTRHLFPEEARKWSLYQVFDSQAEAITLADGKEVRSWNPTTHGSFNDANMPFWRKNFRQPDDVAFGEPAVECDLLSEGHAAKP